MSHQQCQSCEHLRDQLAAAHRRVAELTIQVERLTHHIAVTLEDYSRAALCQDATWARTRPVDDRNRLLHTVIIQAGMAADTVRDWSRIQARAEALHPYSTLRQGSTSGQRDYLTPRALMLSYRRWLAGAH